MEPLGVIFSSDDEHLCTVKWSGKRNSKNNFLLLVGNTVVWPFGLFLNGLPFTHFNFKTICGKLKFPHFEFLKGGTPFNNYIVAEP